MEIVASDVKHIDLAKLVIVINAKMYIRSEN